MSINMQTISTADLLITDVVVGQALPMTLLFIKTVTDTINLKEATMAQVTYWETVVIP